MMMTMMAWRLTDQVELNHIADSTAAMSVSVHSEVIAWIEILLGGPERRSQGHPKSTTRWHDETIRGCRNKSQSFIFFSHIL